MTDCPLSRREYYRITSPRLRSRAAEAQAGRDRAQAKLAAPARPSTQRERQVALGFAKLSVAIFAELIEHMREVYHSKPATPCGAPRKTKAGTCTRPVASGGRCYQHSGSARPAPAKKSRPSAPARPSPQR